MAIQRIKDLAIKTGTYTDRNGEVKGRYENVGSLFQDDQGKQFLTIKATFNPAGIERAQGKDSIVISVFDLKDDKPQQQAQRRPAQQQSKGDFDSDLPF